MMFCVSQTAHAYLAETSRWHRSTSGKTQRNICICQVCYGKHARVSAAVSNPIASAGCLDDTVMATVSNYLKSCILHFVQAQAKQLKVQDANKSSKASFASSYFRRSCKSPDLTVLQICSCWQLHLTLTHVPEYKLMIVIATKAFVTKKLTDFAHN